MDDVFDTLVEFGENEITLKPAEPTPHDVVQAIENEMYQKYGVTVAFMQSYIEYAQKRTMQETLRDALPLPPNFMDRAQMETVVSDCVKKLAEFDAKRVPLHARLQAEYKKMREANHTVKVPLDPEVAALVKEYHAVMLEGSKARCKLFKVAQMTPMDSQAFHRDMGHYVRAWTASRISVHFPKLGLALL